MFHNMLYQWSLEDADELVWEPKFKHEYRYKWECHIGVGRKAFCSNAFRILRKEFYVD